MRLRNPIVWLLLAIALAAGWQQWRSQQHLPAASQDSPASQAPTQPAATDATVISDPPAGTSPALPAFLPREARTTITLIHRFNSIRYFSHIGTDATIFHAAGSGYFGFRGHLFSQFDRSFGNFLTVRNYYNSDHPYLPALAATSRAA